MRELIAAGVLTCLFSSAAAKVEPVRPETKAMPAEDQRTLMGGDLPCLRSGGQRVRAITWTIRAKDGTIISSGAIFVRQRC